MTIRTGRRVKEFDAAGRMKPSPCYDRGDVMKDPFRLALLRGRSAWLTDRYGERNERAMQAIDTLVKRTWSQAAGHAGRQRAKPA